LNPFSKSSPSLVELVMAGTEKISSLYGGMFKDIGSLAGNVPATSLAPALPAAIPASPVGGVYNINLEGIMARSRSDLRQIGEDIISSVDEARRAKGKDTILG
jgi:hypothetical protein